MKEFGEVMIEKMKEVEDEWKKGWLCGEGGGGLGEKMEGRVYNGIKVLMV